MTLYSTLVLSVVIGMFLIRLVLSILDYQHRHQPIPENVKDLYSKERYTTWLNYSMENFRLELIAKGFQLVLIIVLLVSGGFAFVADLASSLVSTELLAQLLFFLLLILGKQVLDTPFEYYVTFVISGLLIGDYGVSQNLVTYSLTQGLQFGVGLIILLQGVRMLINEIVPAFEGISSKLIPDAQPAYDCPLLFTYKPNALLIGFVVAMVVSTVLIIVANATNLFGVFLIPLIITSFFECGTAAIVAEGQGGLRGAVIGTAVAAAAMVLVLGLSLSVFQPTIQDWMLIFGGNDMSLWGVVTNLFAGLLSGIL
jgi:ascorbate-specific PTS system EIIC-type component UlaA